MSILSQSFVQDAIAAERDGQQFPIDFDKVWRDVGYSRKADALKRLQNTHSIAEDYAVRSLAESAVKPQGGRPEQKIYLTVDCLKSFCMVAETAQGREVRKYFIEIEKAYRAQLERQLLASVAAPIADNTRYNRTVWKVWRDSGIRCPYYVKRVILEHYDYKIVNQIVCVTQQTYEDLIDNFRALDGAVVDDLPEQKRRKFRHGEYSKINRREPQRRDDDYGFMSVQLNLFDS